MAPTLRKQILTMLKSVGITGQIEAAHEVGLKTLTFADLPRLSDEQGKQVLSMLFFHTPLCDYERLTVEIFGWAISDHDAINDAIGKARPSQAP